jgi:hypothetical protein
MAETLTYDAGTDTVTTEQNLNADEQDSLKVGEELQAEQESLLAGKYKNAEELENAYLELQKKLGSEDEASESEPTDEIQTAEPSKQVALITDASNEYAEKGELSKETLDKFSEMSSAELVQAYMEMQANAPQDQAASVDLTDGEVNSIQNSVGGAKAYQDLMDWANSNLPKSQTDYFDSLVDSGNAQAIQLAVQGLRSQYEESNGYEGRMLSGKPPKASMETFRSQAELVEAMSDSRYENDPAYRQDLIDKLNRSDLNF